jgi:hypothetical protein
MPSAFEYYWLALVLVNLVLLGFVVVILAVAVRTGFVYLLALFLIQIQIQILVFAEISTYLEGKGLLGITLGEEPRPDRLSIPRSSIHASNNLQNRQGRASTARPTLLVEAEGRGLEEGLLEK